MDRPNRTPLDDHQRWLAEGFLATALAMAKAAAWGHPGWLPDLMGAAQLGVVYASRSYASAVPWPIYAAIRVRKWIRREKAWLRGYPRGFGDCEDDPRDIPEPEPEADGWPEWLERAWAAMPESRREIVERRLRGDTLAAIGRDVGLTAEGVRVACAQELAWLSRGGGPRDKRIGRAGRPRKASV